MASGRDTFQFLGRVMYLTALKNMFACNAFEYRLGSSSHCWATFATESTVGGIAGDTEEALLAAKLGTLSKPEKMSSCSLRLSPALASHWQTLPEPL